MWKENGSTKEQIAVPSRDIDHSVSGTINTEENNSAVYSTNMTITDISVTYDKVVPLNPGTVIEYKKIRLPENSRYIDYSKNLLEFNGTSTNNGFYSNWAYDETKGYWSNTTNKGYESVLNIEDVPVPGDYTSMGYSDEVYNARWYHASGKNVPSSDYGPYDAIITSGLNRFHTCWEDRANTATSYVTNRPKFMWSNYNNSKLRSLYWIMGTMTLPINVALWAGASGNTLHNYQWQSDTNGNWNGYDTTTAVKGVTLSACEKLKS